MVRLDTYKAFWDYIASEISIGSAILVADEAELQKKIKDLADGETILVAVIPSSDTNVMDRDNISEIDSCFVFILKKVDFASLSEAELHQERVITQTLMHKTKIIMIDLADNINTHPDPFPHLMRHLVEGKIHTDPEHNYLGCLGYSISFALRTLGIDNQNY